MDWNKAKENSTINNVVTPPIGEQPEGNLDPLGKLEAVMKSLLNNIDKLGENIKKLKAENQKLKDALGIVTTEENSHGHQ
jgi:uncharacterized protein YaaW (UPF0174 family)